MGNKYNIVGRRKWLPFIPVYSLSQHSAGRRAKKEGHIAKKRSKMRDPNNKVDIESSKEDALSSAAKYVANLLQVMYLFYVLDRATKCYQPKDQIRYRESKN